MRANIACPRGAFFSARPGRRLRTPRPFCRGSGAPLSMKKFDLPLFTDTLFLFFAAGLLALCLFRFYLPLAPAAAAGAACGAAAAGLYFLLSRPLRRKRQSSAAQRREAEKLAFHLAMDSPERGAQLLAESINAAGKEGAPVVAEGDTLLSARGRGFLRFRFEKVTADDLSPIIRAQGEKKAVFAGAFTEEAEKLARAFGVELYGAEEVYRLVQEGGKMPEKLIAPPKKEGGVKEKIKFRFRRGAWRGYLFSGASLLLFSQLTVFPLYYVISGGVLLAIAVLVRFFGKKE